jgi:hypothetical protein
MFYNVGNDSANLSQHPFNRPAGTGLFFLMIPGTSCLATIVLSLRDKIHSTAEALLKLAPMGLNP